MSENSSGLRVLVVDDEPLIRWSVGQALTAAGHVVLEAGSAREALEHVSALPPPDVVLLDYRLPDSNDLRLLETIRQTRPDSVVVLMTAYGTDTIHADAIRLGAFGVLTKPIELGELAPLVRQAHEHRVA
jgi:DNA-binding NtrC family response regulator